MTSVTRGRKLYPFSPKPHRLASAAGIESNRITAVEFSSTAHRSPVDPRRNAFSAPIPELLVAMPRAGMWPVASASPACGNKFTMDQSRKFKINQRVTPNCRLQKPSGWPCHVFAIRNTGRPEQRGLA